jgi:hypothetical protein
MSVLSRWSGGLVARYGPRLPLIVGPLIAAIGFGLLAVPSVGDSYWKTFFPAILTLGLGMATTVAPLTTVVMNSVAQDRAGAASGINNAVARVAGVLAIAVFGIVMVSAFASRMDGSLTQLPLPPEISQEVRANEVKLAGLPIPEGLDSETQAALRDAVARAFVFGFRVIMFLCAGLAFASVMVADRMIPSGVEHGTSREADLRVGQPERPAA